MTLVLSRTGLLPCARASRRWSAVASIALLLSWSLFCCTATTARSGPCLGGALGRTRLGAFCAPCCRWPRLPCVVSGLSGGLRGPVASHALPRRPPHGVDAVAGQPAVIHRGAASRSLASTGFATVLPTVPDAVAWTVSFFALLGALYGAVKALAQSRVRLLLAYGSLSFFSMLWWFVAATRSATPRSALLVGTVGLATSGLLVAWQVVRTRYGDDMDPQAVSGLASGMPQYAVLLSLLALAAMGLPPFGVFAGFMGLLLTAPFPSTAGLFITLLAWLAASWYIMQMVQRLLFGTRRQELRYTDVLRSGIRCRSRWSSWSSWRWAWRRSPSLLLIRPDRSQTAVKESLDVEQVDRAIGHRNQTDGAARHRAPRRRSHRAVLADADVRAPQSAP